MLRRVNQLQYEGLLKSKRVAPSQEPTMGGENRRDVLHKEMEWMAEYMHEERERKSKERKKTSKVTSKMYTQLIGKAIVKCHEEMRREQIRQIQEDKNYIRRVAKSISQEVMSFWEQIGELIKIKHNAVVEAKRREALNKYDLLE